MAKQNLIEKKNSGGMQPEKNFINFVKFESKRYAIPFIMLVLGLLFILLQGNVLDVLVTVLGVVLMIGGNIPGRTKVISIAIYDYVEQLEWDKAHLLAGGMVVFAFLVILSTLMVNRRVTTPLG